MRGIREGALWVKDDIWPTVAMLGPDARDSLNTLLSLARGYEAPQAARWAKG